VTWRAGGRRRRGRGRGTCAVASRRRRLGGRGSLRLHPSFSCAADAGTGKREESAVRCPVPPPQEGKRKEGNVWKGSVAPRACRWFPRARAGGPGETAKGRAVHGWAGLVCVSLMTARASDESSRPRMYFVFFQGCLCKCWVVNHQTF